MAHRDLFRHERRLSDGLCAHRTRIRLRPCLLGSEGDGIPIAVDAGCNDGFMAGIYVLGLARAAFEAAHDHARQRIQGGQPILFHQIVGSMLVDMSILIEAGRNLIRKCCWNHDHVGSSVHLSSAANVFCSDAALEITSKAIHVLGGYGLMKDYPLEKYFRDVKILQIAGGSNIVHSHRVFNNPFL